MKESSINNVIPILPRMFLEFQGPGSRAQVGGLALETRKHKERMGEAGFIWWFHNAGWGLKITREPLKV